MAEKLTNLHKKQVQSWIGERPKTFELLYSFSRDGSTATAFHGKCDNQGSTLTVLYNTQNTVYGGYTEVSWQGGGTAQYRQDNNAFLFRLQLNGKSACAKFPITKNFANAINDNATHGPIFGGGHDLFTFNGSLTAASGVYTLNGSTNFGHTYNTEGLTAADITNDIKTITELEVYKITETVPTEAWRSTPDWNLEYLDFLKNEIRAFMPPLEVKINQANILLLGPVGAGKSSFFNTISSVFRGHITRQACCGSAEKSITSKYRMYKIRDTSSKKPLKFRICDTRGLEEAEGIDCQDLGYVLDGNIPDGYQFNPASPVNPDSPGFKRAPTLNDRIHCVCFVVDGSTAGVLPEKMVDGIKAIQKRIHQKEIPQMMLLTKVDKVCELSESDISLVFQSAVVRDLVESVSQIFGLPRNQILPYKSYEKETELSKDVSIVALSALKQMLSAAEDFMYNYLDDNVQNIDGTIVQQEETLEVSLVAKPAQHPNCAVALNPQPVDVRENLAAELYDDTPDDSVPGSVRVVSQDQDQGPSDDHLKTPGIVCQLVSPDSSDSEEELFS